MGIRLYTKALRRNLRGALGICQSRIGHRIFHGIALLAELASYDNVCLDFRRCVFPCVLHRHKGT